LKTALYRLNEKFALEVKQNQNLVGMQVGNQLYLDWFKRNVGKIDASNRILALGMFS